MRFALLGDHPDGLHAAAALAQSGRHVLATYTGPPLGLDYLKARDVTPKLVGDVEEVLADPAIEAVIVAGKRADRAAQLRRALQSERHVLCVHPADERPDIAYEAALLQKDAKVVLLPLLPEAVHPSVLRLAELAGRPLRAGKVVGTLGPVRLIECERGASLNADAEPTPLASLPGWDVLRQLGGEVAEVSALTTGEELLSTDAVLLAGRYAEGGLFRALFLPGRAEPLVRLALTAAHGQAELVLARGWSGPARLSWRDAAGTTHEESWDAWGPGPAFVEAFEAALGSATTSSPAPSASEGEGAPTPRSRSGLVGDALPHVTWQDALRCLELDDAVRRSVRYRRVSTLEYPEASEEVGFKGTMTLVGCGLLWVILFLVIVSRWVPWLGWLVVPALAIFLGMQVLRWLVPREERR